MTLYERIQTDLRTHVASLAARATAPADILAYVRVTFDEAVADLAADLTLTPVPAARITEATEREATPTPEITWRPIRGFHGYEVSNTGQVRSYHRRGGHTSTTPNTLKLLNGKYAVIKGKTLKVRELMATAFA